MRPPDQTWDEATQRYFALMALRQMHKDNQQPPPADLDALIANLRRDVTFTGGLNSPARFMPGALGVDPKK